MRERVFHERASQEVAHNHSVMSEPRCTGGWQVGGGVGRGKGEDPPAGSENINKTKGNGAVAPTGDNAASVSVTFPEARADYSCRSFVKSILRQRSLSDR